MSEESDKNTEENNGEDLQVVEEVEIPKVRLNKNGTPRKELSPEQKIRNAENLVKAREKALLQKKALSAKSKSEQEAAKKERAEKLAAAKLKKAEE